MTNSSTEVDTQLMFDTRLPLGFQESGSSSFSLARATRSVLNDDYYDFNADIGGDPNIVNREENQELQLVDEFENRNPLQVVLTSFRDNTARQEFTSIAKRITIHDVNEFKVL